MDGNRIPAILVVVGLLGAVGIVGVAVGLDPISSAVADVAGSDEPKPPALLSFGAAGPWCTDDVRTNSSTSVAAGGANTEIVYATNVSLPGPSYVIGGPTLDRLNDSAYALRVPFEPSENATRDCSGVVRYEAGVRIPAGDDPWTLFVYHDGDRATTIYGDSDRSGVGGSASVGGRVSE